MRRLLSALVLAFASLSFSPAHAGGLLQDLFASASRPAPTVMYYAPPQPQVRFLYDGGLRVSRRPAEHRRAIAKRHPTKRWIVGRKSAPQAASDAVQRRRIDRAGQVHPARHAKSRGKFAKIDAAPSVAIQPAPAIVKVETPAIDNDPTLRVGDAYMTPQGLRIYRGPQEKARERRVFVDFRRSDLRKGMKSELAALEGAGHDYRARRIGPTPLKAIVAETSTRTSVDRHGRAIRIVGP